MNLSKSLIIFLATISPLWAQKSSTEVSAPPAILQGGDTYESAFPILYIPFSDYGTTAGYVDDYDGNCGQDWGAPDVVYSHSPVNDEILMIMLCQNSNFDTRLYVFEDSPSNIIACNDDYCTNQFSEYVSGLNCVEFSAGHTYYIVIDGYAGAYGEYSFEIMVPVPGGMIYGSVHDTAGTAISGATARVLSEGSPVWQDTSDMNGEFIVWDISEGTYTIEVSKTGYISQTQGPVTVLSCDPAFVDFWLQPDLPPCDIIAHPAAIIEDEPICYDNFIDTFNVGCSALIWDTIPANCIFFGTSGNYIFSELENRDADWLEFELEDSSNVRLKAWRNLLP